MQRLSSELLQNYVAPSGVEIPNYDRDKIKSGIVHIGPGNFPLAHIAAKTHDLMQAGDKNALNYGIVAVSLNSKDRHDQLNPQNGLYTVAEQDAAGKNKVTVIGSVVGVLFAPQNPAAVVAQIAAPDTRIVSMTITPQAHQSYVGAKGNLDLQNPDIANDLNPRNPPKTIFGFIARAVEKREAAALPGITVMNLDNMEHNGDVLGKLTRQFVAAYNSKLAAAVETKYTFPNSMVDRIVPKTTPELLAQVSAKTGFADASAVPAEPMPKVGSWVIEDKFANGRPAWESQKLVQIVPDVLPYEKMKLRILNVSHSFMANLGDLAGLPRIDQTMNDQVFKKGTAALMNNETGPTLPEVPGVNIPAYKAEIIERFANPNVKDTTWRVAKDAPLQVVLDSARDQIASGGSYELLALNVAAWMRRFRVETNELGGKVDAVHPLADMLKAKAKEGGNNPAHMFSITEVFGDIGKHKEFVTAVATYMESLETKGVKATIELATENSKAAFDRSQTPTTRPSPRAPTHGR